MKTATIAKDTLIGIPTQYAVVDRDFPGYFTDVSENFARRVLSAKANYGILTEVYRDERGRYKLYNGEKTKWVTQSKLRRVRRTKNTPEYYDLLVTRKKKAVKYVNTLAKLAFE